MELQMGKVAYWFLTRQSLEKFLELDGDKIYKSNLMLEYYEQNDTNTYQLRECGEDGYKFDWEFENVNWFKAHEYQVIVVGLQRTE